MAHIQEPAIWHPPLDGCRTNFRITTAHGVWMMQQRKRKQWPSDADVIAYVNHGRWLGLCPHCNGGVVLTPSIATAGWCFTCAALFTKIVWPADLAGIVAALEERPSIVVMNWMPGESVASLLAENRAHRVS